MDGWMDGLIDVFMYWLTSVSDKKRDRGSYENRPNFH